MTEQPRFYAEIIHKTDPTSTGIWRWKIDIYDRTKSNQWSKGQLFDEQLCMDLPFGLAYAKWRAKRRLDRVRREYERLDSGEAKKWIIE